MEELGSEVMKCELWLSSKPEFLSECFVINRNSSKVTAVNFLTFVNSKLNEKNEIILSIIQYSRFNYN